MRRHAVARRCGCGTTSCGTAPQGVTAPVQYGPRLTGIVLYLYVGQFLSKKRTAQALAELFGTPLSDATVAGMAHAISYFNVARDREVQVARLSEQLTGARFAALQAQLNPHFMFNTLNTIAVLVRDGDRIGAVRIVEQLSEVLRRTLGRRVENHRKAFNQIL